MFAHLARRHIDRVSSDGGLVKVGHLAGLLEDAVDSVLDTEDAREPTGFMAVAVIPSGDADDEPSLVTAKGKSGTHLATISPGDVG